MEDIGIGKLIIAPRDRDAIHIAVAPVEAGYQLRPGQQVRIQDEKAVYTIDRNHAIGIVDPFLTGFVNPGEKFWLFLFPGTITSIRHDWTHPKFPVSNSLSELQKLAKDWLEAFAKENYTDLEDILQAAEGGWTSNGVGITVPNEFWIQYKLYTGRTGNVTDYFSCSC
jgi:hypothetical protein